MTLLKRLKTSIYNSFGNLGSKSEIEAMFIEDMYNTHVGMGAVVMAFEGLMIFSSLLQGGPGTDLRRQIYFCLYLSLFIITSVLMGALIYLHRKKTEKIQLQINASFLYAICLCVWSCFVTLLDQRSGPNITVYSYVLMAVAVFCMVKPWQSLLLFGGSFVLLNSLAQLLNGNPVFFSAPLKTYNFMLNSFFTTILTIIFAITIYRYRVIKKHDRMVIQQQYDHIRMMNQQLNDLAMTDQLTGVGNRRFLDEHMQQLAQSSDKSRFSLTGMMLDIDFFKQYNDHYGHQAGDKCLQDLSQILQQFAQQHEAFVVRYGGEEFFLCLPGCTNAMQKADTLRKAIIDRNLVRSDQHSGCVTVSIGLSIEQDWRVLGQDGLLRHCDQALYEAKKAGRNTVRLYSAAEPLTAEQV